MSGRAYAEKGDIAEAEDIWDEKPKRWEYAELRSAKIMTGTFGLYRASEVDAFHEKLKVEHDLLKEHSGRWLHFVAVDYPEIKESLSPQKLMELKEKAEKYDAEHKAAMIVEEELRKIDKKLEAVKTWLIKAKAEGRVSMNVGFSLGLVLGVEE